MKNLPQTLHFIAVKWLYCMFLLALACQMQEQVPFSGELRLGDTTQVHLLTTTDGNRLIGRVTGFDSEKVYFLFQKAE